MVNPRFPYPLVAIEYVPEIDTGCGVEDESTASFGSLSSPTPTKVAGDAVPLVVNCPNASYGLRMLPATASTELPSDALLKAAVPWPKAEPIPESVPVGLLGLLSTSIMRNTSGPMM